MVWPFRKPATAEGSPEILFLGGLSGAGKSDFALKYLKDRRGWCHIEIDTGDDKGVDRHGLRPPWDAFHNRYDSKPLHEELSRRGVGHPHVVLSFSSMMVFNPHHLSVGRAHFRFAYLYGPPGRCLQAFLDRERERGSPLGADDRGTHHWAENNVRSIYALNQPHNRRLLVEAFRPNGKRRRPDLIYEDIRRFMREPRES